MELTNRQEKIIEIVKEKGPVTGNDIADELSLSKSTIRSDLALLTYTTILLAKPKVGYTYNNHSFDSKFNKEILSTLVKDVKSKAVFVKENVSLHDAIIKIFTEDAGTIFVVNDKNYLTGVVSRKDFLKSILGNVNIHAVPVSVIMTRMPNIITIDNNNTLLEAAKKIIDHKIDALPVVEETEPGCYDITGRISKTTISNYFVKLMDN